MPSDERTCECRKPDCHACELAGVKGWLAAQGLHVVTAADKAVLEAMAESRIDVDGWFIDSITEQAAGLAELARREANK